MQDFIYNVILTKAISGQIYLLKSSGQIDGIYSSIKGKSVFVIVKRSAA